MALNRWVIVTLAFIIILVVGVGMMINPILVIVAALLIVAVLVWHLDVSGRLLLPLMMVMSLLIPWQSYTFHHNSKFYLFPLFLLVQFTFVKLWIQRKGKWPAFGWLDVLSILFIISATISMFHAVANSNWSIRYIYAFLIGGYCFYLCLKMLGQLQSDMATKLIRIFVALVVGSSAYAILQYVLGSNPFFPHVIMTDLASPNSRILVFRSSGTFEHPLTAAHVFSVALPFLLSNLFENKLNKSQNYHSLFMLFVLILGIFTTGSRSAIAVNSLSCLLLIFLFAIYGIWAFRSTLIVLLTSIPFILMLPFLIIRFGRTFSIFSTGIASADLNRWNSIQWAERVLRDYWVWGMGPFNSDYFKTLDTYSGLQISAKWGLENSWISLMLEQGIVGFTLFLLLILTVLIRLLRKVSRAPVQNRPQGIAIAVSLITFTILFGTRNAAYSYLTWTIFFLLFYLGEQYSIHPSNKALSSKNNIRQNDRYVGGSYD